MKFNLLKYTSAIPLCSLLLIFFTPNYANAHSQVLSSNPAVNARLTTTPKEVKVAFSEVVEVSKYNFKLINSDGKTVVQNLKKITSKEIKLAWPKKYKKGLFVIKYLVLSPDGHLVSGSIPFAINYTDLEPTKLIQSNLRGDEGDILIQCKCKLGYSQITVPTKAKKVFITIYDRRLKTSFYTELKLNSSVFYLNQLLLSKGIYDVELEIYPDDFTLIPYKGSFEVK